MATTNGWYKFTEYLDDVIAEGLGRTVLGFAPAGRYAGFDTLAAGTSGVEIPVKITHTNKRYYTHTDNVEDSMAVVITNHGVVIWTDNEIELDIPINGGGAEKKYLVYIRYSWVASEGGTLPLSSFVDVTGVGGTPESQVPDRDIDVPIGYITVDDFGDALGDCTYEPLDIPSFADNPIDTTDFARLSEVNLFQRTNAHVIQEIDQTDVYQQGLVLGYGNIVEANFSVDGENIELHSITDQAGDQGGWFYINFNTVELLNDGTLEFVSGGNIVWPTGFVTHTIEQGHTYIFYRRNSFEYVCMGAFGELAKRMLQAESDISNNRGVIATKAGLAQHNKFTRLQQWSSEEITSIDHQGCINLSGNGNFVVFAGDGSDIEVTGVKVLGNWIEKGTVLSVTFSNIGDNSVFTAFPGGSSPGFYLYGNDLPIVEGAVYIIQRALWPTAIPYEYLFYVWPDFYGQFQSTIKGNWLNMTAYLDPDFVQPPSGPTDIFAGDDFQYRILPNKMVELRGTVKVNATPAQKVAALPSTLIPSRNVYKVVSVDASGINSMGLWIIKDPPYGMGYSEGDIQLDGTLSSTSDYVHFSFTYPLD